MIATPVRDRKRLFLIMGHVKRGGAVGALQLPDLHPHVDTQLGVEVRQRLVEHQGAAPRSPSCAGQCHALLLAARQLARQAVGQMRQAHAVEHRHRPACLFRGGQLALFQAEGDVPQHAQMRKQGVTLEHQPDVAAPGPGGASGHGARDGSCRWSRCMKPATSRSVVVFAAARRAQKRHQLAIGHGQRQKSSSTLVAP